MDEADRAQAYSDFYLTVAHRNRERLYGAEAGGFALTHCNDCGREIPEARRIAVPGCERCIACQETFEKESG